MPELVTIVYFALFTAPLVVAVAVWYAARKEPWAKAFGRLALASGAAIFGASLVHGMPLGGVQEGIFFIVALGVGPIGLALSALGVARLLARAEHDAELAGVFRFFGAGAALVGAATALALVESLLRGGDAVWFGGLASVALKLAPVLLLETIVATVVVVVDRIAGRVARTKA